MVENCPALLKPFSESMANEILHSCDLCDYAPGAVIFEAGAPAENLYILTRGKVAIEIDIGSQTPECVHTVTPGEQFGWSAMVPPKRFTASARAVELSTVLVIPAEAIDTACAREPAAGLVFLRNLLRTVSMRVTDTRLQLINSLQWPPSLRPAHLQDRV